MELTALLECLGSVSCIVTQSSTGLIIGALFGYLMKASGLWLSQKTQKAQATAGVTDPA